MYIIMNVMSINLQLVEAFYGAGLRLASSSAWPTPISSAVGRDKASLVLPRRSAGGVAVTSPQLHTRRLPASRTGSGAPGLGSGSVPLLAESIGGCLFLGNRVLCREIGDASSSLWRKWHGCLVEHPYHALGRGCIKSGRRCRLTVAQYASSCQYSSPRD
jgi:hypothetical protein